MTGQECYEVTLVLLFEKGYDTTDYDEAALPMLNLMLAEAFPIENSIRMGAGREALKDIPFLKALADPLPYDDRLCRVAFPYGLAAKLVYDDNDMGKVSFFQSQYVSFANECARAVLDEVEDVY